MFAGIVAFIQKILDWIGGFFPGLTKAVEGIIPSVQAKPTPA